MLFKLKQPRLLLNSEDFVIKSSLHVLLLFIISLLFFVAPAIAKNTDGSEASSFKANLNIFKIFAPKPQKQITDRVILQKKPAKKPSTAVNISINTENKLTKLLPIKPIKKPLPKSNTIALSDYDKDIYTKIFSLQKQAEWSKADREISQLTDMRLLGYILYQRYMHPKYNASETELRDWLSIYSNFATAKKIYKLANRKFKTYFPKPKNQKTLSHKVVLSNGHKVKPYRSKKNLSSTQKQQVKKLKRLIKADLSRDAPTRALRRLQENPASKYLDNAQYDILKADIAAAYFYLSLFEKASKLAVEAADRSYKNAPLAGWIAGLSYWIQKDYKNAGIYFEKAAISNRASRWMQAAASYWAARSYMRAKKPRRAIYWLKQASTHPRSFYGLIAMQSLGIKKHAYNWSLPNSKNTSYLSSIARTENGSRAIALLEIGQQDLAIEELQRINLDSKNTELKEAMFILANKYNVPNISMQLASSVHRPNGKLYDAALYPTSPWKPETGFELSPALIHAFIRQESRFNPYATSRSGAKGLMQIMPKTASYISNKSNSYFKNKTGEDMLLDPVFNISLGQKYIAKLINHPAINGNMLQLIAAYNAGPGRLSRWKRKIKIENDPLLFIEMLPAAETRVFVEQVMANYWIYNLRFYGKTPASLKSIATGRWAFYEDDARIELARKSSYIKYRR